MNRPGSRTLLHCHTPSDWFQDKKKTTTNLERSRAQKCQFNPNPFKMGSVEDSTSHLAYRTGPNTPGIAFITGGARGLGNAIARSFAKDGARGVVIVDILEEALQEGRKNIEALGTKAQVLTLQADVTKEASIEKAVKDAVAEFGRIDYAA